VVTGSSLLQELKSTTANNRIIDTIFFICYIFITNVKNFTQQCCI